MRLSNILEVLTFIALTCGTLFGQAWTEQQTTNELFNGRAPWVAGYQTSDGQVTTNGYLQVDGVGGAGQWFNVNQKSQYQIATLVGVKSGSGWAGFGVTYYDASANQVGQQLKEIKANASNGGESTRYSIGLAVPSSAAYAYVWIWSTNGGGYVQAGDFKVVNYFPEGNFSYDPSAPSGSTYTQNFPSGRNRLINGNFETNSNAQNSDRHEGDEFWNVIGSDDSVYWALTGEFTNIVIGLRMGSKTEDNVIWQDVGGVQPGQEYSYRIQAGTRQAYGPLEDRPAVVAGVDFHDASGAKIGVASKGIVKRYQTGRYRDASAVEVLNFTPPSGTTRTVAWVWTEATGDSDANLVVEELSITPREYEPPQIEWVRASTVRTSGLPATVVIKITDNFAIDTSSFDDGDFLVYKVGGGTLDLEFIGRSIFDFNTNQQWVTRDLTAADNGSYNVYYDNGGITDLSGNTLVRDSIYMGSFEVQIGALAE